MQLRSTKGSLCQPGERRGMSGFNNHVGLERGEVIIKYPARPCIGLERDEGGPENGEGNENEK